MLNDANKPWLGAAYYPEMWPLDNVDGDILQMKEAGCNCMRIAEFAWGSMEPREGEYDFSWLNEVIDKLAAGGIAVVMCTPTATPPQWLTDKYEETKRMDPFGVRTQHGARRHTCPNSLVMREYNKRIVKKMAEEFKDTKGIIGWQIDNEIHIADGGCFCPICKSKFQGWLKERFHDIDALNKAWGMARWSLTYAGFENIIPPRKDTWNHPSLQNAWARFMSDSYVEFAHDQADILHEYFDVPIGTDMMPIMEYDYTKVHKKMDVVMFNHYDTKESLHARMPFWFDFLRPLIKEQPFWNTETLTNWNGSVSAHGGYRPEGFCYVNSWLPIAKGAEMNLYWLWKCHPNGHELLHGSVVSQCGRFMHPVNEIRRLSCELEKCAGFLCEHKVKQAEVAVHFSHSAHLAFNAVPYVEGFDYISYLHNNIYAPLTSRRHLHVDIIDTDAPLDAYKVVISSALCVLKENGLPERLKAWIEGGGIWIAGPLTDVFDSELKRFTDKMYSVLEDWGGVYCKYQIPMADCGFELDGGFKSGNLCNDGFEEKGASAIARYEDGPLKSLAAITEMKMGKGRVIVLGTALEENDYLRIIAMTGVCDSVPAASPNIHVVPRERGLIVLELDNAAGFVELKECYEDAVSGEIATGRIDIRPYEVRVLRQVYNK